MSRSESVRTHSPRVARRSIALLCLAFVVALSQPTRTQTESTLTFFRNYFVTGDYVVGGIGLQGTGVNGMATANISDERRARERRHSGSVSLLANGGYREPEFRVANATFRGHDISTTAELLNPAGTSPCWSSAAAPRRGSDGAHKMLAYRADVLRFLPQQLDATGSRQQNDWSTMRTYG